MQTWKEKILSPDGKMLWTPAFLRGSRTELQKTDASKGFSSTLTQSFLYHSG